MEFSDTGDQPLTDYQMCTDWASRIRAGLVAELDGLCGRRPIELLAEGQADAVMAEGDRIARAM